ncbi:MAG: RelA/SpoT family protein [Syntrophobacteraceae bacterium]
MRFFEIVDQILSFYPQADISFLEKAYVFAAKSHQGSMRLRGEPYLRHPLAVAGILAGMRLDEASIAAGLLHDTLEDEFTTPEILTDTFGPNVSGIVQGVTKLTRLDFSNRKERQTEYLRKMILAMCNDIRVVFVKLADRLHDMRSLPIRGSETQRTLAQETLDIYAPLSARLGIDWMRQELEDLSFRCLEPQAFEQIIQKMATAEEDRQRYIHEVKQILSLNLKDLGLEGRVTGRLKQVYSIYQKMIRQNLDLDHIYDLIAFRIIVDSVKTSYEVLAMIHALWEPVPGRFKDYIAKPKSNMYQSLHTTVLGPYGERMEVQIRTEDMDRIANEGIAAHWLYKEGRPSEKAAAQESQRFSWLRELLEWNKDLKDPKSVFEAVRLDLYPDEVYVFTPQGEVKVLPRGATPVDFAYEVHTEVGNRCVGGRVNGKLVPLRHELQNGDTVEVLTSANHRPSKDWLKFVKTSKAISRIRNWFKAEERERSIALGREICEREFRKKGLNFNNYFNSAVLLEAAKSFSLHSVEELLASIGYKEISAVQLIGRLSPAPEEEPEKDEGILVEKRQPKRSDDGIKVVGVDDVLTRMAKCCNPLPGEPIAGYITRGRGITVHRASCSNVSRADRQRKIDVHWDSEKDQAYPVDIKVVYFGDKGMLAVLNGVLGQLDVSVVGLDIETEAKDDMSACRLRIEVKDTKHLQRVLSALRAEKGVYRVLRNA